MSVSPHDRDKVSDDVARELLGRAAALDEDGRELAQLRDAAIEAGISGAAFDRAVEEWRVGRNATREPRRSWRERVLRNAVGFAGGWLALSVFAAMDGLLGAPWLIHKLTDPLGVLVGAAIALKLRARVATVVMAGLTISQAVEFLLDLLTGTPAIHGRYPHIGLMLVGIGGVAVSQWWRSRATPQSPDSNGSTDYSTSPIGSAMP